MKNPRFHFALVLVLMLTLSCSLGTLTPGAGDTPTLIKTGMPTKTLTPTLTPADMPTTTLAPVFAPAYTPGGGACEIVADGSVSIYQRPEIASGLFGTFSAGDREQAVNYTADDWIGFEPGVAQAGNVGVFRNRWVQTDAAFHLEGDCGGLPVVVGPPSGVCFNMGMTDTPVYQNPDASSAVVATLHLGDYVEVTGKTAGWVKVNLGVGSLGLSGEGWMTEDAVSYNGPCEDLPIVAP
jgi:hypothetical protein